MEVDRIALLPSYPDLTIPSVDYCRAQTITIAGVTKNGYLPAAGQLVTLVNNIFDVNTALSLVGGNTIGLGSGKWWGSTQHSYRSAWGLENGSINRSIYGKNFDYSVLPFFDF